MPRVYRAMLPDGNKPRIGRDRKSLGVVVDGDKPDITADSEGKVTPGTGGMSVAPTVGALPDHRIPRRLVTTYPRATGSNQLVCWRLGNGPFVDGSVAAGLTLVVDSKRHGTAQPDHEMLFADYEAALSATQDQWVEDET